MYIYERSPLPNISNTDSLPFSLLPLFRPPPACKRRRTMTRVYPNTAASCVDLPSLPACCGATREDGAAVLTVWRKSLLFSCNGFTVFDAEGNLVFRVDIYGSGSAGELVLMDASGKPLLTARRKVHTTSSVCLHVMCIGTPTICLS